MDVDVIVIGAGIAGASVAAELALHRSVLILEAEDSPGYHTSGRSAATFIENYGAPAVRALSRASRAFLEGPPEDYGVESLTSPRGLIYAATQSELPMLEEELNASSTLEALDLKAMAQIVPLLARGPCVAGAYERDASDIDVNMFLTGALRAVKRRGGILVTGSKVSAAERVGERWQVKTGDDSHSAPVVVNAAGAWGDKVAQTFGVQPIGLQPLRRSVGIVELSDDTVVEPDWPLIAGVGGNWYTKPEGRWLLASPADETPSEACDAWPLDEDIAAGIDATCIALGARAKRLHRTWAGLRTFAPDKNLVAGFDDRVDGFFWLVGQGGYGFQTGPAMAAAASALACGLPLPDHLTAHGLDADALDPRRFRSQ